ncbi:phosphoadenosine phosphosulfate reductase family protein [Bacteroides sp.]|uniref:phosphoadenosine phosphosulfate reductase family protein n=1 Tax=Bacteroides sp. TaxID=29523 RepID=UPI00261AE62C|nr:phosphoadenosine phosphosulfate reductase family protein [Bacteroides sp.]MDD3041258.1 phosphoadenosine phosphosulfate reductase family protein [Bacteroides sp.]
MKGYDRISKYTSEDLKTMQNWSLERKIRVTQLRIMEWYERWDGKVYVSFSGGKDSTVLLDLARRIYPDIDAVFSDTGLEYPEIRAFVKSLPNITVVKPEMSFKDVIQKYGYPVVSKEQSSYIQEYKDTKSDKLKELRWNGNEKGMWKISEKWKYLVDAPFLIGDKCCDIIKKKPLSKYGKETGKHPITAVMACESSRRKMNWLKNGCNAFESSKPISQPMSFWLEQDVLRYLNDFQIPYSKIYGEILGDENGGLYTNGEERTGCMFCMYGVHAESEPNRFQRMKSTHPKQYDYCIRPVEENGLGIGKVLDYIGVPYE